MTLVLNMHPNPAQSVRGKMIIEQLKSLNDVTIHTVAESFSVTPTKEQIMAEQNLLRKHNTIVFLYPV